MCIALLLSDVSWLPTLPLFSLLAAFIFSRTMECSCLWPAS